MKMINTRIKILRFRLKMCRVWNDLKNSPSYRRLLLEYYFIETPYRLWMKFIRGKTPTVYQPMTFKYCLYAPKGFKFIKSNGKYPQFEIAKREPGNNVGRVHKSTIIEDTWKELDRRLQQND